MVLLIWQCGQPFEYLPASKFIKLISCVSKVSFYMINLNNDYVTFPFNLISVAKLCRSRPPESEVHLNEILCGAQGAVQSGLNFSFVGPACEGLPTE